MLLEGVCDELLLDKLQMAQKALQWLAVDKYESILQYYLHPHFEILLLCAHVLAGCRRKKAALEEGLGALNLVNVFSAAQGAEADARSEVSPRRTHCESKRPDAIGTRLSLGNENER
jgi:hypothetical protein